jgi:hypothetical protein
MWHRLHYQQGQSRLAAIDIMVGLLKDMIEA